MAIVICFLVVLMILACLGFVSSSLAWSLIGAGAAVALLGFLDDHGHIAARWRLLGHFLAAAWALYCLGGLPPLSVFGGLVQLSWIGHVLAAFYLVWLLNLYNFMDGIDGIASVEAICVCLGGALLYVLTEAPATAEVSLLMLTAAVMGFLIWNFPPARIFMGDAGSGFLGMVMGIFSLQAAWIEPVLFWAWLILLGIFIVDATLTLFRRLLRGERVYEAHRSHAYQHASRRMASHLPVTVGVAIINLAWLLPLSVTVALGWLDGLVGVAIAYAPLLVLAWLLGAGMTEVPADA